MQRYPYFAKSNGVAYESQISQFFGNAGKYGGGVTIYWGASTPLLPHAAVCVDPHARGRNNQVAGTSSPLMIGFHMRKSWTVAATTAIMAIAGTISVSSPALALETSPVITPNVFAPGPSPSLDVTFTVTSAVSIPGDSSVWEMGIGIVGATTVDRDSVTAVTNIDTGVITCDFGGGVSGSFTSVELAGLNPTRCVLVTNSYEIAEEEDSTVVWFTVYFELPRTSTSATTVTAQLNPGAITFPSTNGVFPYEAYTWNDRYVDLTVSSYTVANASNAGSEIRRGQGLPMPSSGNCADVKDADYAWGTGLTGGWTKGWEPWVNASAPEGHRGGWACIRTLVNRGGNTWLIE